MNWMTDQQKLSDLKKGGEKTQILNDNFKQSNMDANGILREGERIRQKNTFEEIMDKIFQICSKNTDWQIQEVQRNPSKIFKISLGNIIVKLLKGKDKEKS